MNVVRLTGSVRVVGAGLLGTSVGLALTKAGLDVSIEDASPAVTKLAIDFGAGRASKTDDSPSLIVVCVPPDVTAKVVADELNKFPNAVVTDVASVKSAVLNQLEAQGADLSRYVGSHPMAGRERGGALSGRADLFATRPWVIAPTQMSSAGAVALVEQLALDLGAIPSRLSAEEHDQAVALVSHTPQLVSSLLAARLNNAESSQVALAGQGLRDTTRIAASDPKLWMQILGANSSKVSQILRDFQVDLTKVIDALENIDAPGSLSALGDALTRGNQGVEQIPGKHGAKQQHFAQVIVMIDDRPGQFAKLLNDIAAADINLEDVSLEHAPGAAVGLVQISVAPTRETDLISALENLGWRLAG